MSAAEKAAWKAGDWCFCDFKLSLIEEISDAYASVSDGDCQHSGGALVERFFPLTKRGLQVSLQFQYWSDRLHRDGAPGLNYPDIHGWLVDRWTEAMCVAESDDDLMPILERLSQFGSDVLEASRPQASKYGFPIMRTK